MSLNRRFAMVRKGSIFKKLGGRRERVDEMIDFIREFSTEKACLMYLARMRWDDGVVCPQCGEEKIYCFKDEITYKCATCKKIFTARIGTIFHNSKVPLAKWFLACYLLTSHKKGISSIQLSKDINVTQPTAWKMLHKVRRLFTSDEVFSGIIQVDECFIGGKEKNKHRKKRTKGTQGRSLLTKAAVMGMLSEGQVKAVHVPNLRLQTIKGVLAATIEPESCLWTDEYGAYSELGKYEHKWCNHSKGRYVDNGVHTNNIENFWSLAKRAIIGIYHWVSKEYLQNYLNEFVFRYNTRDLEETERVNHLFRGKLWARKVV